MRALAIALASGGCVTSLHVVDSAHVVDHDLAPAFSLTAQDGRTVVLADELRHGPVALVFYRGYW